MHRGGRLRARLAGLLRASGSGGLVAAAPALPLRDVLRRFWPDARPYRRYLIPALVLVIALPAVDTAQTWLWKLLVDDVLVPRDMGAFAWIAAAFVGLTILSGAVGFGDEVLSTWIGERFVLGLRTRVFRHVQTLSPDFFERRRMGDVLSRITGDVGAIETLVLSGVADAISYAARIVFFGTALFLLQWRLALVALVVVPPFFWLARRFSRLSKEAAREKRRRSGSLGSVAEESLSAAALVQSSGREDDEAQRFEREGLGSMAATMASVRIKALFAPVVEMVELIGGLLVIGAGVWLLSRNELTLGGLLAFMAYLALLYSPVRSLGRLASTFYSASAAAERVIELLDERPAVADPPRPVRLTRVRGALELDDVSFRYPAAEHDALRGVSFRAEPGEVVALVGASGAGKSTIAKLLLRFYDPAAGAVRLDGVDLRELALADVRAAIALLAQEAPVLDATAAENIAFGARDGTASAAEIARAARAADAHEFIARLPDGYDTRVGQRGRLLSGGQRQRLAVARALVRDAPALVLDEPATGLDASSSARVLGPLRALMEGRTAIVISHGLHTVRDADRIVVLDGGEVVAQGAHDELLRAGGVYARLWAAGDAGRHAVA